MEDTNLSLLENFQRFFDIQLATTETQRKAVFRIRYRVYCEEFGYERPEDFPDRRERDCFDAHSLHCLITHRRSGHPAGCVRLVCASDEQALPIESYCLQSVYRAHLDTVG